LKILSCAIDLFLEFSAYNPFIFENLQQRSRCFFGTFSTGPALFLKSSAAELPIFRHRHQPLQPFLEMCDNLTELFLKRSAAQPGFFRYYPSGVAAKTMAVLKNPLRRFSFLFCFPLRFHRENTLPYSKNVYTPFRKLPVIGIPME